MKERNERSSGARCRLGVASVLAPILAVSLADASVVRAADTKSPFDTLKAIPLVADGSSTLTLGGELRERYEYTRNPQFGLKAPGENDYLLQRASIYADAHIGPNFRTFVGLVSGLAPGWSGTPPATQEDRLDLLQAFGEATVPFGSSVFALRGGRQELSLGSSRLVGVRESPNIRREFDGARGWWADNSGDRIDAFLVRPVTLEGGTFDDEPDGSQLFGGLYSTWALPMTGVDLYYLGLQRDDARFSQGTGDERRHSVGLRLFGQREAIDWNLEGVYQWGSFGSDAIQAWTASADVGYTLGDVMFSPRLGLKADAISGDGDLNDGTLRTFNPLFPKLPYFSDANLVEPANLLDLQPNVTMALAPGVTANVAWNPLWKDETADAFYVPPLVPASGTANSDGRFIGQQVSTGIEWKATDRLTLAATYVHFEPSSATREAGGQSGDFAAASVKVRF